MPAKPLTNEQLDDAKRLKAAMAQAKILTGLTQADLAALCGWESQSTVSQYANGRIPLNVDALGIMCIHLRVPMHEISPTLARRLAQLVQVLPREQRRAIGAAWPFKSVDQREFEALSAHDRHAIEQYVRFTIDSRRARK